MDVHHFYGKKLVRDAHTETGCGTKALLHVTPCRRGLMLRAEFPRCDAAAGDFFIELLPGESFGGHDFEECEEIALGRGYVDADWLIA